MGTEQAGAGDLSRGSAGGDLEQGGGPFAQVGLGVMIPEGDEGSLFGGGQGKGATPG
jgi:hypothetical protein